MRAYREDTLSSYFIKPDIYSGSTFGEATAIKSYIRTVVAQLDISKCIIKRCNQRFHKYLHSSRILGDIEDISEIKVLEQGTVIIDNMALLRNKSFREWGFID